MNEGAVLNLSVLLIAPCMAFPWHNALRIRLCGTTLLHCKACLPAAHLIQACSHTDLVSCNIVWLVPKSLQTVHGISMPLQEVMH